LANIEKRAADYQDIVTLSRSSIREHFITLTPEGDEPPESLFDRAGRAARERDAEVVSVEALGMSAADRASMEVLSRVIDGGDVPIGWVENARTDNLCGLHLWLVSGAPIRRLHANGRCVGTAWEDADARYCRIVGLTPSDVAADRDEQTRLILREMGVILADEGMTFANVIRTWFYNDDILDWYDRFNAARNAFFEEHAVFDGVVPASTGVGGRNALAAALVTGLVAVEPKGNGTQARIVTSPLQRCCAFAIALGERHGLPVKVDARFAEVGFGSWEGRTRQELEAEVPGQVARFLLDPVGNRPLGAELLDDFTARVQAGLGDIVQAYAGQRVLLVAHAGVIRSVMAHVLGMPPAVMYRINVANAGLTRIRTDRERTFNLVSHGCP